MTFQYTARFLIASLASLPLAALANAPDVGPLADFSSCAKPAYPKAALRNDIEGKVTLEFRIAASGKVLGSKVLESSGIPVLDRAAQSGLERCAFKPAMSGGVAVEATSKMQYVWTLDGRPRSAPAPFAEAPAALRTYLLQARAADSIADPLARCLAFPDLPGNQWQPGLAAAYCHATFEKAITLAQVSAHLERGALAELDALYRHDLERHFSKDDFSEVIHLDSQLFDASAEAGRVSALWLAKAPRSPFAHAMRGAHLDDLAHQTRGFKYASETAPDKLDKMSQIAGAAIDEYSEAIRLEARLLPAYTGTINLAKLDGRAGLEATAFAKAAAIDPACKWVIDERMSALSPRWGGSTAAMQAYARTLEPLVAARPLVVMALALPAADAGYMLYHDGEFARAAKLLEPVAALSPQADMLEDLGVSRWKIEADESQTLAYLVAAYRYSDARFWSSAGRGALMSNARDPAWALKALASAAKDAPDEVYVTRMRARAHYELHQYALAAPLFMAALSDKNDLEDTLFFLGDSLMRSRQLDQAEIYSTRLLGAFPASASGWQLRANLKSLQGADQEVNAALLNFLKFVDRKDRGWQRAILYAESQTARQAAAGLPPAQ